MKNLRGDIKNYRKAGRLRLIKSGTEFFEVLEQLINGAKTTLHLQIYILENDAAGNRVITGLLDAAARGVEVYLIVDAFGSKRLPEETLRSLRNAGIHFRRFSPINLIRGIKIGRRLHHKVLVVDSYYSMIGGINISDNYLGKEGKTPWLDFAVLIEGPYSREVERLCRNIWDKKIFFKAPPAVNKKVVLENACYLRLAENDWILNRRMITRSYRSAFRRAEKEITLIASYFIPGTIVRYLLQKASARGVRIRIILSGLSDVAIARRATSYLYHWLLRQKIELYEYQPSIVHAKVCIVDRQWCTIGSFNLNHLSELGSVETNINIYDDTFVGDFAAMVDSIIQNSCRRVTIEDYLRSRTTWEKLLDWCSFQLVRASMLLLYFFTRKDQVNPLE